MSPKDFHNDLLLTLATRSDWKAMEPVHSRDVIEDVCNHKGLSPNEYGIRDNDQKPWVVIWIRDAFRSAKRKDLGVQVKRGWWALTYSGLAEARDISGQAVPKDGDSKVIEPDASLSVPVGPGNSDQGYHPDPEIRALAASRTDCYGHYSLKAPTCKTCGLSGGCQKLVASIYTQLAEELAAEDAEKEAQRKLAEEVARIAETPVPPEAVNEDDTPEINRTPQSSPMASTPPTSGWDNTGAQKIVSFIKSTCYRCGKEIPRKVECWWIKDGDQRGGMFHLECK
jgi:hypothetical protein